MTDDAICKRKKNVVPTKSARLRMSLEQDSVMHVEPYRHEMATKLEMIHIRTDSSGVFSHTVNGSDLSKSTRSELLNVYNTMRREHYAKYVEATDRLKKHYNVNWIKWRCPYDESLGHEPFPEWEQMRVDNNVKQEDGSMRPWHIMHYGTCSSCFSAGEMFTECPCQMPPDLNANSKVRKSWRNEFGSPRKFLPARTRYLTDDDIYNPLFLAQLFNGRVYFSTKHPVPDKRLDTDCIAQEPEHAIWEGIITADEWNMINKDS